MHIPCTYKLLLQKVNFSLLKILIAGPLKKAFRKFYYILQQQKIFLKAWNSKKKKKDFFSRCSNHVTSGHTQKSSEVYLISFHRPVLCLQWLLVVPAAQHLHLRKSILILHFTSGTAQIYSTPTSASPSTCYHGFKDTYHSI